LKPVFNEVDKIIMNNEIDKGVIKSIWIDMRNSHFEESKSNTKNKEAIFRCLLKDVFFILFLKIVYGISNLIITKKNININIKTPKIVF